VSDLRHLCVYCGSNFGASPVYRDAAEQLGALLATRGITLVYGGGNVGLMGVLANAALQRGGQVIGVIPHWMVAKELAHKGVTKLHVVESMHDRKQLMADLSDGFIALPGGIGTLEELIETFTWLQLGLHRKPVGALNVAGYFDPLLAQLRRMCDERFLKPSHLDSLLVADRAEVLLGKMESFRPTAAEKWLGREPRERGSA